MSAESCHLLMLKVKMMKNSVSRVGGLCVGIFSSLQGWLVTGFCMPFNVPKNSVGSGRESHVNLNLGRMLIMVYSWEIDHCLNSHYG